MRKLLLFILLLTSTLTLTACGVNRNQPYSYSPPDNVAGKRCIAQCYAGKNSCENLCLLKNPSCTNRAYREAQRKFDSYKQQQIQKGKPIRKHVKDFENTQDCKHACNCTIAFNTCYSACGGEVSALWR